MNCHSFELVINDLARNQIMDAAAKSSALAHADACARCAARLKDENALTAGLASLATSMESEAAPPRIEEMLRAALREKVAVASPRSKALPRWAVAAAIAAILATVALIALNLEKSPAPEQAKNPAELKQPEQPKPAAPDKFATEPALQRGDNQVDTAQNDSPQKINHQQINHQRRARASVDRNKKSNLRPVTFNGPPGTSEIATDFIPLVQGENLSRMDGGQVVRVEMPRSALLSYGLPMNVERADERIKADLVIGNDGLARAIRFVR